MPTSSVNSNFFVVELYFKNLPFPKELISTSSLSNILVLPPPPSDDNCIWTNCLNCPNSLVKTDFQEYVYTAGVNDDGVGLPLDEFIQFQIKIVMQGTDAAKPVRIKDLRAIALAT